jgi:hypothetical protein
MCASLNVIMKYYTRKNRSDMIRLARMQLNACIFRLTKKNHTEFVLQCSIINLLIVFDIKITKSPRIPNLKRKVDISSNFNGRFH